MSPKKRYRDLVERAEEAGLYVRLAIVRSEPVAGSTYTFGEASKSDPADLDACLADVEVYLGLEQAYDAYLERWR